MYEKLSDTITRIVEFTNKHRISANFHIHSVGDLRGNNKMPDEYWAKFEKYAGVYLIFNSGSKSIHYIGMSKVDTGNRLYHWLFGKGNKVYEAINDSDLVLSVVLKDQSYMSPALESYLIDKLNPEINTRK
jgi:hypothetical protein